MPFGFTSRNQPVNDLSAGPGCFIFLGEGYIRLYQYIFSSMTGLEELTQTRDMQGLESQGK